MSYRLGVSNIYEFLDDDNDGGVESGKKAQALLEQQKKNAEATLAAAVKSSAPKPANASAAPQTKGKPTERKNVAGDNKGPRQGPRTDRPDRKPRNATDSPRAEGEEARFDRPRRDNKERPDRVGAERRGPRVEGEAPRGNKRVFDRKSGTGRGKEDKKGGAGKGNWGTLGDEQKATIEEGIKAETEETKKEGEEPASGEAAQPHKEKTENHHHYEAEEEEKVRSLGEYLTEVKSKAPAANLPAARKAGEGVDDAQWSKFVPLKRTDEEGLFGAEGKQKKEKDEKAAKDASKKVPADQVIKFQKENPKRAKETRGAPPAKKGPKPGKQTATPNITDESSFPALSPKA
jgi:plasminogen activator inhibitor 1 RNA-binding protein